MVTAILTLLIIFFVMMIIGIFSLEKGEVEMFEGEPRYVHIRECGYRCCEDEYWDRKEQKSVIR